jgi:hypothetical protein
VFSYSGDPSASDLDKVRFLIRDTDEATPKIQDEEILWAVSEMGDAYEAARACCESIAASFASKSNYSKSVGDLTISEQFHNQSTQYLALADRLLGMRLRVNPPTPVVNANALVSTENRNVDTYNTDSYLGIHDYDKGQHPK